MGGNVTLANRPILISDIKDARAGKIAKQVNIQKDWRQDAISMAGIDDEYLTGAELVEFRNRLIAEFMKDYAIEKEKNATVKADNIIMSARYDNSKGFVNFFSDLWNYICKK